MVSQRQNIQRERFETSSGIQLRYSLALPDQSQAASPFPLILALHYGWDQRQPVPPFYGEGFLSGLVLPALSGIGAVFAAPDCPDESWTTPKSEQALLELLDFLKETCEIDPGKTLLTGYSLGGVGTLYMASTHPELFTAAIPMAGWPPEKTAPSSSIPLYIIHSQDDEIVPFQPVAKAVREMQERGIPVELELLSGITHFESNRFEESLKKTIPWIRANWGV